MFEKQNQKKPRVVKVKKKKFKERKPPSEEEYSFIETS